MLQIYLTTATPDFGVALQSQLKDLQVLFALKLVFALAYT